MVSITCHLLMPPMARRNSQERWVRSVTSGKIFGNSLLMVVSDLLLNPNQQETLHGNQIRFSWSFKVAFLVSSFWAKFYVVLIVSEECEQTNVIEIVLCQIILTDWNKVDVLTLNIPVSTRPNDPWRSNAH